MPRRKKKARREAERDDAAAKVAAIVGPPRTKKKSKGASKRGIERVLEDVQPFIEGDKSWDAAKPQHLVALYALCHADTYGVDVVNELVGYGWLGARSAVEKLIRDEFDGSIERTVEFLRWTWKRESGREEWRRQHGKPGGRITWRAQFQSRSILNEYRIELERRRGN